MKLAEGNTLIQLFIKYLNRDIDEAELRLV